MLLEEIRPLGYENIAVVGAGEDDIDDALLWSFAKAFEDDASGRFTYNTAEFLKTDLLLAVGSVDEFIPTVAAVLLFGKNERVAELLPRSSVTAIRYSGETTNAPIVEQTELKGNLLTLFESSVAFIKRYCDLWNEKPRLKPDNGYSPILARANYSQNVIPRRSSTL